MVEATSCGGVVIYHGKILLLFKQYKNKYEGWVLPKGTVEPDESHEETAVREVAEETGVKARIKKYIGISQYKFTAFDEVIHKQVIWYLMQSENFYSRPQREEYFVDSGYYKFHEAVHLLKFSNEKRILEDAFQLYRNMKKDGTWDG